MKKRNKILLIITSLLLTIGLVSGALVTYLSNTIETDVSIVSPFALDSENFEFDIAYSGDDGFALVEITNLANRDLTGDIEIAIGPDSVGISTAVSDDINYCFSAQGDMTGVSDCESDYEVWLSNNIDWMDWVADSDYSDVLYPNTYVVNTAGDSFIGLGGYVDDTLTLPDVNFPAETTVYGLIYIATDVALAPDTYTFGIRIIP